VDTMWGQGSVQVGELKDILAPIDIDPVFRNPNDLTTWYVNPLVSPLVHQSHAYPHCGMVTINTDVVPPNQYPKKFQDLLNPFFKGKIMMDDPLTSITPDTTIWGWWVGLGFADWYLDAAYDLLNKDSGYVQIGAERDLVRGQTGLLPAMRGTTGATPQFYAENQGVKNLKVLQFADQPIACSSTIMMGNSVFAKAPHPNAARLWSNWFISKDGQTVWTGARAVGTIRKDVTEPIKEAYRPNPEAVQYWDITIDWMGFMNEVFAKKIALNLIKQGMSRQDFKDAMKEVSMNHFKQFPPPPMKLYSADEFYKGYRK
jgi:ABC-type Fe3+ transport system substrate-binding protein